MFNEKNFIRRPLVLAFIFTWLAAAALPGFAAGLRGSPDLRAASNSAPAASSPVIAAASSGPAGSPDLPDPFALPGPTATPPPDPAPPAAPASKSQNVTINLINRLVKRGALTQEDADELKKLAEQDAVEARKEAAAAQAAQPPPASDDTVRVGYVPEVVKSQMREEIKQEVLKQARDENWAAPRTLPEWVSRFNFNGDVRIRYEGDFYPAGNDNTGAFPNFNAINTGAPFDVSGTTFSPQLNVDQDRERVRLRARFGVEVDLQDGFTSGIRIATGENNSPVTTNQSLGAANNSQGGNFSKYGIWLDRGFLKYESGGRPTEDLAISVGRFDNPFFATSEIVWDDDLGFDGLAVQGKEQVVDGVTPFINAGVFPVFNTDLNFSTNRPDKFPSEDKWLYAGQVGANWKIDKDFNFKLGGAFYDFENIQGRLSDPFVPLTAQDGGNTDDSRPSFAQKGNTYMELRNITPTAANGFGTIDQFQYFGLASRFEDVVVTGKLDYNRFEPFNVSLVGEFVKNVAFNGGSINSKAVNNRGPDLPSGAVGPFVGGDSAWIVGLNMGSASFQELGDWTFGLSYRYVESDAVVDGFCDSDFGGGGTNVKGFTIGGSAAINPHVWVRLRWMSSDEVAGPTLKNDIVQVDLNGKF